MTSAFASLGKQIRLSSQTAGFALVMLSRAVLWVPAAWRKRARGSVLSQCYVVGVTTIPVVLIVSLFTGMILALNGGITLQEIGQEKLIGRIVGLSMVREMGPFMTALILAASVGSAMAAELSTMTVSEEIDAIRVLAVDPVRYLVVPRVLALAIMCPILTAYANLIGIGGGAVVSMTQLGVSFVEFKTDAVDSLAHKDLYTGLFKSIVFGITIATVGCGLGLRARGGAIGVGQATRRCVVYSYVLIIVFGYYITWFFYR